MDRSMEVDRSIDNVPFNGINSDENDNDGDDEENENNEIILEPEIQLGRPIRQRNMPQRFLETPDTPPRIQNNRRNPRIIVDDDENELIDNFILENRNNNLLNDPQIEVIRLPMNINENPMYNYVAPNPWRNNALLAVNNLLNPPVNIIPPIVILSTEEKNVKRMQLKAALNEAASGLVSEIELIDQPSKD
jgi:hypothetical protein